MGASLLRQRKEETMAETIREAFIRKNPRSAMLYAKFKAVFPTGVSHDMRATDPFPLCIARGQGSRKWDVDGNEYIDFGMGSASLLLGHAHPAVVEALVKVAPDGSHYGQPIEAELEWGERVHALIPCADKIRFVASGAEATMLAMRVARGYTGKEKIIRWESHYHGWHDYGMPGNLPPFDTPASIGIPKGALESVIVLPPDLDLLEQTLASHTDVAGVITEGSGASYGTVPLKPGFVEGVRALTQRYGVVMILDEVITGFRWSPGGLQQKLGIVPDLCSLAKILTGGMPGGAVAGTDEVMGVMARTGDATRDRFQRVSHGGTFNSPGHGRRVKLSELS
jgi:glutamate-1-semialdehyde 2,1-aminomutase